MPLDPLSLIAASLINGLTPQLLRKFMPAGADKAQLEQVNLKREEIAAAEHRHLDTQRFQRQLKFDEIEKMVDVRRQEKDYDVRLQRWPLGLLPMDFLKTSEAHGGRSLNIILNVVDTHEPDFYRRKAGEAISERLDMFHNEPLHVLRNAVEKFHGDVILYHEVTRSAKVSGNSLKGALWNLLQTEPTILVEVNMSNPNEIVAYVSQWGCAFTPNSPPVSYTPQTYDLAGRSGPALEKVVAFWLTSLVVSIGDAFRTLQMPHVISSPVYPSFIQEHAPEAQRVEILNRMLNTYTSAYDGVATHSPLLASELAAQAALTAQELGQSEFADALLTKALSLHPALDGKSEIDPDSISLLRKHRRINEAGSPLYSALKTMRNVSVSESPVQSGKDFEQLIRSSSKPKKDRISS